MFSSFKKVFFILCLSFMLLAVSQSAFSQTLRSKYFNIYLHKDVDRFQLLKKLEINQFLHLDAGLLEKNVDLNGLLNDALDTIYLEVCDILDIHMYSFKINLEVSPDKEYLNDILKAYFEKKAAMPAFYFYDKNRIYISFEDLNVGMFSHEIAHAILSHYFVVPPTPKIQEVLSGYVEYSIRKATGTSLRSMNQIRAEDKRFINSD